MSKYVIVDLEMCHVPYGEKRESFNWRSELIQIGAVVVNEELEMTDEFMTYVSPEFGEIDAEIESLTGISKKDVEGAPGICEALQLFLDWLPKDSVLVSWSENDELQIRRELEEKEITIDGIDDYLDNWIDCQQTFSKKMDAEKIYKLSEALIISDIDYDENQHDGLVDAKNTAQLFIKMQKEPVLKLNPYYSNEAGEDTANNPFAALLAGFFDEEN